MMNSSRTNRHHRSLSRSNWGQAGRQTGPDFNGVSSLPTREQHPNGDCFLQLRREEPREERAFTSALNVKKVSIHFSTAKLPLRGPQNDLFYHRICRAESSRWQTTLYKRLKFILLKE